LPWESNAPQPGEHPIRQIRAGYQPHDSQTLSRAQCRVTGMFPIARTECARPAGVSGPALAPSCIRQRPLGMAGLLRVYLFAPWHRFWQMACELVEQHRGPVAGLKRIVVARSRPPGMIDVVGSASSLRYRLRLSETWSNAFGLRRADTKTRRQLRGQARSQVRAPTRG
jgi:hypothetical protein